jgi:hypothetical protein
MKALILSLMIIVGFAGVIEAKVQKKETARVQIHKTKQLRQSKIKVQFLELIEDSRCPTDTNCVWAGNAKIRVKLTKNGRTETTELDTMGDKKAVHFYGYSIMLTALTPEPASNIRIDRNGYVATFEAVKLSR